MDQRDCAKDRKDCSQLNSCAWKRRQCEASQEREVVRCHRGCKELSIQFLAWSMSYDFKEVSNNWSMKTRVLAYCKCLYYNSVNLKLVRH